MYPENKGTLDSRARYAFNRAAIVGESRTEMADPVPPLATAKVAQLRIRRTYRPIRETERKP